MEVSILQIIILSIWAAIAQLEVLTTGVGFWNRPIIAGTAAGLIAGNVELGVLIGSMLEMTSLGVWSYGGAAVPDYTTGAVIGVMVGVLTNNSDIGLTTGVAMAAITQNTDVLARTLNSFCAQRADKYAAEGNIKQAHVSHYLGVIPWGLSRIIPVLIVGVLGNTFAAQVVEMLNENSFILSGFQAIGAAMPALGFVILLTYLPFRKQWWWVVLGFVLSAYLGVPTLGIALLGLVCAIVYTTLWYRNKENKTDEAVEQIGGEF